MIFPAGPGRYMLWMLGGFFFSLFCAFPAPAEDRPVSTPLTLTRAVAIALENNHEIKAMKSAAAAGRADIGIARSYLLPKISVEERYLRTNNPGYALMSKLNQSRIEAFDFSPDVLNRPEAINDFQSSVFVEQPLFVKKAFVGLQMSRTEWMAKEQDTRRKVEDVVFSVVKAYLNVLTAKAYVDAAKLGVADAEERMRISNVRYRNDVGQYADFLRASTSLAEAKQKLNAAQKGFHLAGRSLGVLLALSDSPVVADEPLDLTLKALSHYTEAGYARADVRALALRGENAQNNVRLAEAGYFPYVGLGGSYSLNDHQAPLGAEGKSWQVMAFLRWDLFDGTKREYERVKAKHQEAQVREHLSAMKKGVSLKIYEAYLNALEANQSIDLALEALKTSEESARLLKRRYENGLSSLSDLLNVQASLEQARASVIERKNAYQTALAALSFESGTLLEDLRIDGKIY